jgi:hypothetical protein
MGKLWDMLSGWKTVLAALLLNVPFLTEHPLLWEAAKRVSEDPSFRNIVAFITNVLLVVGATHITAKNLVNPTRN